MFIASTLILLNLYARIIIATLQYVWFFHQFWPLKIVTSFMDRPQAWMFFDDLVTTTNIRKPFTAIHWSNERRRARKSGAGSFTYLLSDLIFFSYLVNIFWVKPFLFALTKIYNVANQIRHVYWFIKVATSQRVFSFSFHLQKNAWNHYSSTLPHS